MYSVGVDAVGQYPTWLYVPEDSPLHFLQLIRESYIRDYYDPLFQLTAETGPSWVPLFFAVEFAFLLPTVLYALYRLFPFGRGRASATTATTTGPLELLLLVYSFEVAFTSAVCINDVLYWDPAVYSPAQKNMFIYQLFGPWFLVREFPARSPVSHARPSLFLPLPLPLPCREENA